MYSLREQDVTKNFRLDALAGVVACGDDRLNLYQTRSLVRNYFNAEYFFDIIDFGREFCYQYSGDIFFRFRVVKEARKVVVQEGEEIRIFKLFKFVNFAMLKEAKSEMGFSDPDEWWR
ncbi:hypothetical protein K0U07_05300 [bacterium]|nr:hypothetical protein [bacterium]